MATSGTLSALIYQESGTLKPYAYFRDASSGATSTVALPTSTVAGNDWSKASYVLANQKLWVLAGRGPVYVREYGLLGSPLPTSVNLLSTTSFGDSDTRVGDIVSLASGGIFAAWHQQGQTGQQGQGFSYRAPGSQSWSTTFPVQFMPTMASFQTAAQNPADGSIWVFSDADAFAQIGVAHLTEGPSGLTVDWTDSAFITKAKDGGNGPDGENPDLQAVADPSTGTIALAYESATREWFSNSSSSTMVVGSYVAVARVSASGAKSFISLPQYVERISTLGLAVGSAGETWLTYRPVDANDLSYDDVYRSKYSGGSWSTPKFLGTLSNARSVIYFNPRSPESATRFTDGKTHLVAGS